MNIATLLEDSNLKLFSNQYFELIHGHFKGLNLTAIRDPQNFFEQQVVDSIYPFLRFQKAHDSLLNSSAVLDLGCGGGVPILPLAWKFPSLSFLGIDGKKKKATAVQEMGVMLGLKNVKAMGERMERIYIDTANTSVLVKAVGKIEDVLPFVQSKEKVRVFFYKGSQWEHLEFAQSNRIHNNWKLEEVFKMSFPNLGDRFLLMYEGTNNTSPNKESILLSKIKMGGE
jgi:16S rRNA (guanine527-N7)-methyltransferase